MVLLQRDWDWGIIISMEDNMNNQIGGNHVMPNVQSRAGVGRSYSVGSVQPVQPVQIKDDNAMKKIMILMIILALFAIGGMFFGMTMLISKNQEVGKLNETISEQKFQLEKDSNIGVTAPDTNTNDYIYVGQWGLKIKVPEGIRLMGYDFERNNGNESLWVTGIRSESESVPSFIPSVLQSGGLASVARTVEGYGFPYGRLIFTYGGYDYYYTPSQVTYSTDEYDIALENEARELVGTMLTNAENYSLIEE